MIYGMSEQGLHHSLCVKAVPVDDSFKIDLVEHGIRPDLVKSFDRFGMCGRDVRAGCALCR